MIRFTFLWTNMDVENPPCLARFPMKQTTVVFQPWFFHIPRMRWLDSLCIIPRRSKHHLVFWKNAWSTMINWHDIFFICFWILFWCIYKLYTQFVAILDGPVAIVQACFDVGDLLFGLRNILMHYMACAKKTESLIAAKQFPMFRSNTRWTCIFHLYIYV